MPKKNDVMRELIEEIDLLDSMITSLVDLLEKKGIISHEEWEKRIKQKVKESVEEMHKAQYPGYYDDKIYLHGLGWYQTTIENETYGGHEGNYEGARTQMRMRYSDKVGILYFSNQNSFILMQLKKVRPNEKEAAKELRNVLFEKVDELLKI